MVKLPPLPPSTESPGADSEKPLPQTPAAPSGMPPLPPLGQQPKRPRGRVKEPLPHPPAGMPLTRSPLAPLQPHPKSQGADPEARVTDSPAAAASGSGVAMPPTHPTPPPQGLPLRKRPLSRIRSSSEPQTPDPELSQTPSPAASVVSGDGSATMSPPSLAIDSATRLSELLGTHADLSLPYSIGQGSAGYDEKTNQGLPEVLSEADFCRLLTTLSNDLGNGSKLAMDVDALPLGGEIRLAKKTFMSSTGSQLPRTVVITKDEEGTLSLIIETKSKLHGYDSSKSAEENKAHKQVISKSGTYKSVKPAWKIEGMTIKKVASFVVNEVTEYDALKKEAAVSQALQSRRGNVLKYSKPFTYLSTEKPDETKIKVGFHSEHLTRSLQDICDEPLPEAMTETQRDALNEKNLRILEQMCAVIQEIHDKGYTHQDIKPENFLVRDRPDGSMELVISDFGETRKAGIGSVGGSPAYMSPQVFFALVLGALDKEDLGKGFLEALEAKEGGIKHLEELSKYSRATLFDGSEIPNYIAYDLTYPLFEHHMGQTPEGEPIPDKDPAPIDETLATIFPNQQNDMWSLGITILQLVTKMPLEEIHDKLVPEDYETESFESLLNDLTKDVAEPFKAVIHGCLQVQPQNRMSIDKVLKTINQHKQTLAPATPPPAAAPVGEKSPRARRGLRGRGGPT